MLRSIGLGNSNFQTRISESEVGELAEFQVAYLEIRLPTSMERYFLVGNINASFGAQWNTALSQPLTLFYFCC